MINEVQGEECQHLCLQASCTTGTNGLVSVRVYARRKFSGNLKMGKLSESESEAEVKLSGRDKHN